MEIFASYSGQDFLLFYAIMLATCVLAGLWIPANLRAEGRPGEVEDLEEVAVLTGGAERLNLAVLSSLFARGALDPGSAIHCRLCAGTLPRPLRSARQCTKAGNCG
jgi:uncharacterized protein (TIGR04222 family)